VEVEVDVDVLQDAGRAGPGQGGAVSAFALFHHQIAGLSNPPPCISLLADQIGCKKYYECSKCQMNIAPPAYRSRPGMACRCSHPSVVHVF